MGPRWATPMEAASNNHIIGFASRAAGNSFQAGALGPSQRQQTSALTIGPTMLATHMTTQSTFMK